MKRMIQKTWMACIALMCVCFASCNDDAIVEASQPNETGKPFRLTANQETPSRLALGEDGLTVMWEPGDKLYLVKKDRTIVPIYMNAELTAPSTSATFVSETGVPAGEYWVIYNYNDHLVYKHRAFASIDEINNQDNLVLWGELTVSEGDTDATITLQHLYAKVRVELQNLPSNNASYEIGMYASKTGFPVYQQLTQNGIENVDNDNLQISIKATNRRFHNIRFGHYYLYSYWDDTLGQYITGDKTELEKNSVLLLPADVSSGTVYFYVLDGMDCYEIPKSNLKFEAGKNYKVVLDMATATKTTLGATEITLPGESNSMTFFELTSPEDCRHAAYRGNLQGDYVLKNDINFEGNTYLPIMAHHFDGNNKKMTNITIDWPEEDYVGMIKYDYYKEQNDGVNWEFRHIDPRSYRCIVSNLTLENITVNGNNFVGALGGYNIEIENCILKETAVKGTGNYVGGFVGCNDLRGAADDINELFISKASLEEGCKVEGESFVGGIVGGMEINSYVYSNRSIRIIKSCSSAATVTATGDYVGGIFGAVGNYNSIDFSSEDCAFSLHGCVNTGDVIGNDYVGGIGGKFGLYCNSSVKDKVVILSSANEGNITGVNYVGGIVGSSSSSFNSCYSIGNYSASGNSLGGILGEDDINYSYISNCYSMANLSIGTNGNSGGIVGCTRTLGIENCYFAGTNSFGCGIVGFIVHSTEIKNCLTTLSSLFDLDKWDAKEDANNDGVSDVNDVVTNSFTDITSILQNKSVINNDNAYSDVIWQNYPYDCVKFAAGLSGSVVAPGFGTEIIY